MLAATITQSYPAHNLDSNQRQTLALELIKKGKPVSDISKQNNVSRKFLYQQKAKAVSAIHAEFNKIDDSDVLFYLPVTKWGSMPNPPFCTELTFGYNNIL